MGNLIICFLLGGACGYLLHSLTQEDDVKLVVLSKRELSEDELKEIIQEELCDEEDTDRQPN